MVLGFRDKQATVLSTNIWPVKGIYKTDAIAAVSLNGTGQDLLLVSYEDTGTIGVFSLIDVIFNNEFE